MPYVINRPKIVMEQFEDESILINLETGAYYSLNPSASEVLRLAELCPSTADVVDVLSRRYRTDASLIAPSVTQLLADAVEQQLVRADPGSAGSGVDANACGSPFVAPRLARFDDMKEILLLDPIHDVDESGWPTTPADSK